MSEAIKGLQIQIRYLIYLINSCFDINLGLYTFSNKIMSNLKAIKRDSTSSGSNNKLRSESNTGYSIRGKIPNQNISIQLKEIKNIINSDTFLSKVLELEIEGKKKRLFQEMLLLMLFLRNQFI